MRKFIIGCVLSAVLGGVAYAGCFTNPVVGPNGGMIVCTTCCDAGGMCSTTCTQ